MLVVLQLCAVVTVKFVAGWVSVCIHETPFALAKRAAGCKESSKLNAKRIILSANRHTVK